MQMVTHNRERKPGKRPAGRRSTGELAALVRSRMTLVASDGHLSRWGNSPATHLNQRILAAAGVHEEQPFDILASDGVVTLVFAPKAPLVDERSRYEQFTLEDLLPIAMKPGRKSTWPKSKPRSKESW